MNDFKGFDLNDPALQAPSPEERQARTSGSELQSPFQSPLQSGVPSRSVFPPFPASPVIPAGSALPMGSAHPLGATGILPPRIFESDWPRLVPPSPSPAPTPPAPPLPPRAPSALPALAEKMADSPAPPSFAELAPAGRPHQASTFQRAVSMFRAAMPLVQRILPLLDGNVGTAVSNLMAPQQQGTQHSQPVNLVPIETGLDKLQLQQRELRDQVVEQNESLKKVEDQLHQVREATDRNTLEQQELLQDLKAVGTRVNIFAYVALALLGLSVALNVLLFLQLRHILP